MEQLPHKQNGRKKVLEGSRVQDLQHPALEELKRHSRQREGKGLPG
jgi:hypothetical protein